MPTTADTQNAIHIRALSAILLGLMAVGGLVLWIGVPAGVLWGLGELVDTKSEHLLLGLLAVPVAMIAAGLLLGGLNSVYLRVNGLYPPDAPATWRPTLRGPLERILVVCAVIALFALLAWLIFGSEGTAPLW